MRQMRLDGLRSPFVRDARTGNTGSKGNSTMSYQVKSWFGAAVPSVVSHPAVRSLAEKWFQITTERDPCLSDFWHNADDAFLDNAILLLKGETDYTYLHHGRALQQRSASPCRACGWPICAPGCARPSWRSTTAAPASSCSPTSSPSRISSRRSSCGDASCSRCGSSSDDARPAIVLYCHPIDDKASAFKTLFEKSRSGIVIAAPVKNETGDIVDAWIIAQNEQARHLTGVYDPARPIFCCAAAASFARRRVGRDRRRGRPAQHGGDPLRRGEAASRSISTRNSSTNISCCA